MWRLIPNADLNIGYILLFGAIGIGLVYGIDSIYRRVKKRKTK
jgi:hypothetical protein